MRLRTRQTKEKVAIDDSRPGRWREGWQKLLNIETLKKLPKSAAVVAMAFEFQADSEEGAYVFELDCGFQPEGPYEDAPKVRRIDYVVAYNKPQTAFPAPGVEDIAELLVDAVNLSAKNGMIWFVHPIYFAEQLLRVRLSKATKREIAYCEDLPPDLPAPDSTLVFLQWGRRLAGMRRICLESDGPEEVCTDTDRIAVQVSGRADEASRATPCPVAPDVTVESYPTIARGTRDLVAARLRFRDHVHDQHREAGAVGVARIIVDVDRYAKPRDPDGS